MKTAVIFDFEDERDFHAWHVINDVVMGGRSSSQVFREEAGKLVFSGNVSLENNGGFASVRSGIGRYNLHQYDGITLRVKGDGNRYAFNLRAGMMLQPTRFEADFETHEDHWQQVTIPFEAMVKKAFGMVISETPYLNKRAIRSFGFLISDKQSGPFRLEIDWIKAYIEEEMPE